MAAYIYSVLSFLEFLAPSGCPVRTGMRSGPRHGSFCEPPVWPYPPQTGHDVSILLNISACLRSLNVWEQLAGWALVKRVGDVSRLYWTIYQRSAKSQCWNLHHQKTPQVDAWDVACCRTAAGSEHGTWVGFMPGWRPGPAAGVTLVWILTLFLTFGWSI
jgi:hypothetical protein